MRLVDKSNDNPEAAKEEAMHDLEIGEVEAIEPKLESAEEIKSEEVWEQPKANAPKLTVVGKIDLEKLKKFERPKKRK